MQCLQNYDSLKRKCLQMPGGVKARLGAGMGMIVGGQMRPTPGAMIAVVKGLAPATTPDRLRLIAGTVAPVHLVMSLSPGVMLIQFLNPADAGLFAQSYNGRKLDNAVIAISIEVAR